MTVFKGIRDTYVSQEVQSLHDKDCQFLTIYKRVKLKRNGEYFLKVLGKSLLHSEKKV